MRNVLTVVIWVAVVVALSGMGWTWPELTVTVWAVGVCAVALIARGLVDYWRLRDDPFCGYGDTVFGDDREVRSRPPFTLIDGDR